MVACHFPNVRKIRNNQANLGFIGTSASPDPLRIQASLPGMQGLLLEQVLDTGMNLNTFLDCLGGGHNVCYTLWTEYGKINHNPNKHHAVSTHPKRKSVNSDNCHAFRVRVEVQSSCMGFRGKRLPRSPPHITLLLTALSTAPRLTRARRQQVTKSRGQSPQPAT